MNRRILAVVLLGALGCTSSRYVGSVGRDRAFVNRGYGFLVRLSHGGLSERFDAIVAENYERFPASVRPKESKAALDLDADGFLAPTERTLHYVPALRLLSRTSTAVFIDVDVQVVAKKNEAAPLEEVVLADITRATVTSSVAKARAVASMRSAKVAPDFDARIHELRSRLIATIDQPAFRAEEGIARRQIVRVTLVAPALTDSLRADHAAVLAALILNRRAGLETTKEEW